jgi:predicted esterase YcpF (UPF0227 family)
MAPEEDEASLDHVEEDLIASGPRGRGMAQRDNAADYRRQAQEIRIIAQQVWIDEARHLLFESAMHLEALAEEEERRAQGA